MVDWPGWMGGWLVGWLIGWLAGWLFGWLVTWLIGLLIGRWLRSGKHMHASFIFKSMSPETAGGDPRTQKVIFLIDLNKGIARFEVEYFWIVFDSILKNLSPPDSMFFSFSYVFHFFFLK